MSLDFHNARSITRIHSRHRFRRPCNAQPAAAEQRVRCDDQRRAARQHAVHRQPRYGRNWGPRPALETGRPSKQRSRAPCSLPDRGLRAEDRPIDACSVRSFRKHGPRIRRDHWYGETARREPARPGIRRAGPIPVLPRRRAADWPGSFP